MENFQSDPRLRFHKLAQDLISFAFPSLRMLKGSYDESVLSKAMLEKDDLLTGGQQPLSEAEQEILTYVQRNQNSGERTSVEEMVRQFSRRPYGWYPLAVLTLIGRLFRMGKIELRTAEPLDARAALEHLKNSRQHGALRVRLQEQFDSTKVNALKRFHRDFFDRENNGTDARSVGQFTLEAFAAESKNLTTLLDESSRYAFLSALKPAAERIARLAEKDHAYLLNQLGDFSEVLLDAKEDFLDPIKSFMKGAQRIAYDEAITFLREEEANFGDIPEAEIKPLRDLAVAATPYRGNVVPAAKAAVAQLRQRIEELLSSERQLAMAAVTEHEEKLRQLPDFGRLSSESQDQVLAKSAAASAGLASARFVTAIRDRLNRYCSQDYPAQLALACHLAVPPPPPAKPNSGDKSPPKPAPAATVYVPAASLKAKCNLTYLNSEKDLDEWIAALRQAALDELAKGNRISL